MKTKVAMPNEKDKRNTKSDIIWATILYGLPMIFALIAKFGGEGALMVGDLSLSDTFFHIVAGSVGAMIAYYFGETVSKEEEGDGFWQAIKKIIFFTVVFIPTITVLIGLQVLLAGI